MTTPSPRADRVQVIIELLSAAPEGLRQADLIAAVRERGWPGYDGKRLLDDRPQDHTVQRLPVRGPSHDIRWFMPKHWEQAAEAFNADRMKRKKRLRGHNYRAYTPTWFDRHRPNSVFDFASKILED